MGRHGWVQRVEWPPPRSWAVERAASSNIEFDDRQAEAPTEVGSDSGLARGIWPDDSRTLHRLIMSQRCPLQRASRGSARWAAWASIPPPWVEELAQWPFRVRPHRPELPVTGVHALPTHPASRTVARSCRHVIVTRRVLEPIRRCRERSASGFHVPSSLFTVPHHASLRRTITRALPRPTTA